MTAGNRIPHRRLMRRLSSQPHPLRFEPPSDASLVFSVEHAAATNANTNKQNTACISSFKVRFTRTTFPFRGSLAGPESR